MHVKSKTQSWMFATTWYTEVKMLWLGLGIWWNVIFFFANLVSMRIISNNKNSFPPKLKQKHDFYFTFSCVLVIFLLFRSFLRIYYLFPTFSCACSFLQSVNIWKRLQNWMRRCRAISTNKTTGRNGNHKKGNYFPSPTLVLYPLSR